MKDRSFFRRFSKQHLSHFMRFMRCRRFERDEVLFVVDGDVMVMLDGLVHMKSHAEEVVPPKMLAKLEQGDIIGCPKLDNGTS